MAGTIIGGRDEETEGVSLPVTITTTEGNCLWWGLETEGGRGQGVLRRSSFG